MAAKSQMYFSIYIQVISILIELVIKDMLFWVLKAAHTGELMFEV